MEVNRVKNQFYSYFLSPSFNSENSSTMKLAKIIVFCFPLTIGGISRVWGGESDILKLPTTGNRLRDSTSAQLLLPIETSASKDTQLPLYKLSEGGETGGVEYSLTPLQLFPLEPMTVETANMLPRQAVYTTYGTHIYNLFGGVPGIGLQVYNGSIDWGIADNFQAGLALSFFDDILGERIGGRPTNFGFFSLAGRGKYRFVREENYDLAVVASLEWLKITSENRLFNGGISSRQTNTAAISIQVPYTYKFNENTQWHIVGGLNVFPETINNGGDFYGTFFNLGTGVSIRLHERFGLFADVNMPIGPGHNSVDANGRLERNAVWSAGFNYLHSPGVAIDLSVTNRLGTTAATRLLAFPPGGGNVALGLNVRYTPDIFTEYPSSFASTPPPPLTERDKQLLFDGITLTTAETLRKGTFFVDTGLRPNFNIQVAYGMSDDAQLEFIGQQLSDSKKPIGNSFKFGGATKLRFLNQARGDAFSFSIRGAFLEASEGDSDGVGAFSAEGSFSYSPTSQLALFLNPKGGFFGNNRLVGLGLGVNFQLLPGLQFLGEVTPMLSNDATVWAIGARYFPSNGNLGIGLYGTNAAASGNIGSMITRKNNDFSVGVNFMWLFGD